MSDNEQENDSVEESPESSPDVEGVAQTPDPFDETTVADAMEEARPEVESEPALKTNIKKAMRQKNSENIARKRDLKTAHLK